MPKTIQITLEDTQIADLQRAFPELDPVTCTREIARFATIEMIGLLAGKKRYTSLSHQYVDWLEQLNANLLPNVEFTPRRVMNQFNFPPGTASYIARVLRDRQNVRLMERAWKSLLATFKEIKTDHDAKPPKERGGPGQLSVTLTRREYRQLLMLLDEWEAEQLKKKPADRKSINVPEKSEDRLDYIKIKYKITEIESIIGLLAQKANPGG
jgi:hypothetical protein